MSVQAQELGWFTRQDFVAYLSREVASASPPGSEAPVVPSGEAAIELRRSYYAGLLAALEKLLIDRGLVSDSDLQHRCRGLAEARRHDHRHA